MMNEMSRGSEWVGVCGCVGIKAVKTGCRTSVSGGGSNSNVTCPTVRPCVAIDKDGP